MDLSPRLRQTPLEWPDPLSSQTSSGVPKTKHSLTTSRSLWNDAKSAIKRGGWKEIVPMV